MIKPVTITFAADGRIGDVDFVQWILNEIEDRAFNRKVVSDTYAILIQKGHRDFKQINEAIIQRWSMSGLLWIKTQAWKKVNETARDAGATTVG